METAPPALLRTSHSGSVLFDLTWHSNVALQGSIYRIKLILLACMTAVTGLGLVALVAFNLVAGNWNVTMIAPATALVLVLAVLTVLTVSLGRKRRAFLRLHGQVPVLSESSVVEMRAQFLTN